MRRKKKPRVKPTRESFESKKKYVFLQFSPYSGCEIKYFLIRRYVQCKNIFKKIYAKFFVSK